MKLTASLLPVACLVALLASCAPMTGGSASNKTRAQYLDEAWVTPELRGKAPSEVYQEVMFSNVSTRHLHEMGWWAAQSQKTQADLEKDAARLGRYMKRSFEQAVANYPGGHFRVVHSPSPQTMVIDLSITELVPAKKFWNAAATGAGFAVPGAGLLGMAGKGSIGIEGRVYDGATARVLAGFKDRESDATALINTNQFTWYGGSEKKIDELAGKTAAMLNAPKGAVITKSSGFQLMSN
jgi:hypothetical protein